MKPWHFGALSGLAMCRAELGGDTNEPLNAMMPPLRGEGGDDDVARRRRKRWVETALGDHRLRHGDGRDRGTDPASSPKPTSVA